MPRKMTLTQYADTMPHGWFTRVAGLMEVDVSLVSMWVSGKRPIPVSRCFQLERLTSGRVRAEWIRPDVDFKRTKRSGAK